jgi:galactokinase
MDQMASALGSVVAIDFGRPDEAQAHMCPFDPEDYGLSLVIVSTGGSHADLTDEYAAIPGEMKAVAGLFGRPVLEGIRRADLLSRAGEIRSACGDRAFLRAWHFAAETERPLEMADAMARGDIDAFLAVVRASGDSSWRLLQNVQPAKDTREQGLSLALALTEEFLGGTGASRVHGGGFAGTIQAYIPAERFCAYRDLMDGVFGPGSVMKLGIRPCGVVRIETV